MKSVSEEVVMKKLRGETLPKKLEVVFHSMGVTLSEGIERASEFENRIENIENKKDMRFKNNEVRKRNSGDKEQVVCYKCNKVGHYRRTVKIMQEVNLNATGVGN
jgi:hypothetical protein